MSQTHIDSDKIIKQRNFEIFTLVARIYFTLQTGLYWVFLLFNLGTGIASGNENITGIIQLLVWVVGFGLWVASIILSIIANNISAQTKSPARGLAIASMVLAIVSFIPILSTVIHIAGIVVSGILISKLNKFATKGNHVVEVEAKESNDA
jgi:hypothetical protein